MIDKETLEAIEAFHEKRIDKIRGANPPWPLSPGGKIIIHLIPVKSIVSPGDFGVSKYEDLPDVLRPKSIGRAFPSDYIFDGLIRYTKEGDQGSLAYTLFFRTGIIEWVDAYYLGEEKRDYPIRIYSIEQDVVDRTKECLDLQKKTDIKLPIIYYLHFLGTKGIRIPFQGSHPVLEDELLFPKMIIKNYDIAPEVELKTRLDQLWNAFGHPRSLHYDEKSNWIKDPR